MRFSQHNAEKVLRKVLRGVAPFPEQAHIDVASSADPVFVMILQAGGAVRRNQLCLLP